MKGAGVSSNRKYKLKDKQKTNGCLIAKAGAISNCEQKPKLKECSMISRDLSKAGSKAEGMLNERGQDPITAICSILSADMDLCYTCRLFNIGSVLTGSQNRGDHGAHWDSKYYCCMATFPIFCIQRA